MPIKFRCQKCRQFLGISRAQAGEVVDCPTCGRATRVPSLDGTRKPVPQQPGLEKADSSLLNALDQLADLGKGASANAGESENKVEKPSKPVAPVQLSEPIDVEPLQAGAVVDPPSAPGNGLGSTSSGSKPDPSANTSVDSAVVLKNLAARAEPMTVPTSSDNRSSSRGLLLLAGLGMLATFGLGWFVRSRAEPVASVETEQTEVVSSSDPEAGKAEPVNGITGRVTFRKSEADCIADRGARVIAWPIGLTTEKPWSLDGFRANDQQQRVQAAIEKLRERGGDLTLVQEDGSYELNLVSGGDYEVLILSHFAGRRIEGDGISRAQIARLKVCFKEPERLIGQTQFALLRMKYRGEGQQLLDHVFEVAD